MKKILLSCAGALFLACSASQTFAVPITGTLDIAGGATLDSTNLATATQVSSFQNVVVVPNGVTAGSALDTFINPGDAVTMNFPWVFGAGIPALWNVGGYTFNLATSAIVLRNGEFLAVGGSGLIVGHGFDPTPATWYFTTQGTGDNANFSFSATTVATAAGVPEGSTTALLAGLGLIGAAVAARARNQRR